MELQQFFHQTIEKTVKWAPDPVVPLQPGHAHQADVLAN